MPDPTLHENGYRCPACELRREARHGIGGKLDIPCNQCDSTGRIALSTQHIVDNHVRWAREHYWPSKTYT